MKTKFRVLSVIMTVAMILSSLVIVVPTTVSAATDDTLWPDAESIWDASFGYDELEFDENEEIVNMPGTEANPYQIDSADALALFAYYVNNAYTDEEFSGKSYTVLHYVVTADIDATAHQWISIGNRYASTATNFGGVFDGGNFTIKTAVTKISSATSYTNPESAVVMDLVAGLFGYVKSYTTDLQCTIKNVKLETTMSNVSFASKNGNVGGLTAGAFGAKVENCHVTVNANGTWGQQDNNICFGALCAYTNTNNFTPSFKDCTAKGTFNVTQAGGSSMFAGGLVGRANGGDGITPYLENCVNYMDMTNKNTRTGTQEAIVFGGLISYVNAGATNIIKIVNCANFGDITAAATSGDNLIRSLVGGAIGRADANGYIQIDGFINAGQFYYSQQRGTAGTTVIKSGSAQLIAGFNTTDNEANSFANCYTLTGGDAVWTYRAYSKLKVNGETVTEAMAAYNYYRLEKALTHIGIDYQVVEEGEGDAVTKKTVVTLNKGAMDVLKACGATVTVTRGSASTAVDFETATATATAYEIPVAATSGAVSVKVEQKAVHNDVEVTLASETIRDLWIYRAADSYAGGTGTEEDPYIITDAAELARVARDWNQRILTSTDGTSSFTKNTTGYVYYQLGDDIDLAGREWTPIGHYGIYGGMANSFYGDFDGNGKTIKNMTITTLLAANCPAGLFGTIRGISSLYAQIHDFNMTGASITRGTVATAYKEWTKGTGLVVGAAHGSGTIDGVNATGTILTLEGYSEANMVGGILGGAHNAIVQNCTMNGTVTNKSNASGKLPVAGGIVGMATGLATITNCTNNAKVVAQGNGCNTYAGGIIGYAGNQMPASAKIVITGCVNNGEITTATATTKPNNARLGGIIGGTGRGSDTGATKGIQPVTITNCINTGYVHAAQGGGSASGYGYIIGIAEDSSTNGASYALNINNVYSPLMYDNALKAANATNPGAWGMIGSVAAKVNLNGDGATGVSGENISPAVINPSHYYEVMAEVDGETATIKANKNVLDILLASGYTMELTYGETVITDVSKATGDAANDIYTWTNIPAAEGEPTLVCTRNGDVQEANNEPNWSGVAAATAFAGGDGSANAPWEITNAAELGRMAKLINDPSTAADYRNDSYKLMNPIDLAGKNWTPVGLAHHNYGAFNGKFYGNNQTIDNLYMNSKYYGYNQAFFGRTNSSALIENVTFVNPVIRTNGDVDSASAMKATVLLIGAMYGGHVNNVDVVGLDMHITRGRSAVFYGGFIGYLGQSAIIVENCEIEGKITGTFTDSYSKIGTFVGRARYGTVRDCVSDVNIDVSVSSNGVAGGTLQVGGIVAIIESDTTADKTYIQDNVNRGNITVTHRNGGKHVSVAGIVGAAYCGGKDGYAEITGNTNTGNIKLVSSTATEMKEVAGILGAYSYSALTVNNNTDLTYGTAIANAYALGSADPALDAVNNYSINTGLTTKAGAAIRLNTAAANSGLRFTSSFITAKYDELVAKYGAGNVTFGTVIAPTALVDKYEANKLPASVVVPYDVAVKVDGEKSVFTGAIQDIKDIDRDFTAVAYMTVKIGDVEYTIYADYAGEENRARNMKDVADRAFSDRYDVAGEYNGYDYYTNYDNNGYSCYSKAQLDLMVELYGAEFVDAYKPVVAE